MRGIEHIPRSGPALIVCRHYHHYYDGCVLLATLPRGAHILVALDWVGSPWMRAALEAACGLARWPVVLRGERLHGTCVGERTAFRAGEVRPYLRRARTLGRDLLREGEVLVMFPEAYPTIDPIFTPRTTDDAYLPFRRGFIRLVELAQRDGRTRVAIVPAGLHYERDQQWRVRLRLGPPMYLDGRTDGTTLRTALEEQVRMLSGD